ncbi:MAG: phosphoribosylformylglycinamidine synthase subunit PurS, partial [Planctomycetota bacterium]
MSTTVHRIEVRPREGQADPMGEVARRSMQSLEVAECPERVDSASVYLIEADLDDATVERIGRELLADPV